MALAAATVWEVRTTGADTNGGGFVAGASGTDYSQQAAAQYALTNGVTQGTTVILTASADTDMIGNIVYVTGGTGAVVAAWYQITAASAGVSITVDRSTGLTAGTGVTLNVGGALATLVAVTAVYVASNKIFVKATATYTITATNTFTVGATPTNAVPYTRVIGYTTTRGDNGRASITLSTNTGLTALRATGAALSFENFLIDCSSLGTSIGIDVTTGFLRAWNIKVINFTTAGIRSNAANPLVEDCEVTGGTSAATAGIVLSAGAGPSQAYRNYVHDNACPGIAVGQAATLKFNIVVNNSGASSDGMSFNFSSRVLNNTVYNNGRHGLNGIGTQGGLVVEIRNNILVNNGGFGLVLATAAGFPAAPSWDGNAYYNNTSGTRSNADDTTVSAQNGVAPYTNVFDKILSGDPFTNAAGGDFTLNNTTGAGASCRAGGTPGALPGVSQLGYMDMGALQHQDLGVISVSSHNPVIINRGGVAGY